MLYLNDFLFILPFNRIPAAATLAVRSFQSVKQGSLTEDLDVSVMYYQNCQMQHC